MATLNQIKVNTGTEDSPSYVLHDVHDKRLDDGASSLVTTCTHLLATNAALSSFNPITSANLASVLGAYLVRYGGNGDGPSRRISINNPYKTPFTRGFFIACNTMRANNYGLFWASGSNVVALSENKCYIQAENITEGVHAGIHYDGGYVTFYTQDQDETIRFYALYY